MLTEWSFLGWTVGAQISIHLSSVITQCVHCTQGRSFHSVRSGQSIVWPIKGLLLWWSPDNKTHTSSYLNIQFPLPSVSIKRTRAVDVPVPNRPEIRSLHSIGSKHPCQHLLARRACQSWAQIYNRASSRGFKVSVWVLRVQLAHLSSCANLQTDPTPSQMIHNVPPRPVLHAEARWETCTWGPFTKDQREIS